MVHALRSLAALATLVAASALESGAWGQSNVRPVPIVGKSTRSIFGPELDIPWARPGDPQDVDPTKGPDWRVGMRLEATALAPADLDGGGERTVARGGWRASLSRTTGQRTYSLLLDTEASFYDWSSPTPLAGGSADPFNDLYRTELGAAIAFAEDAQIGWFTGWELALTGEDDASLLEAASVGAVTGVRVQAADDLHLSFGLAALTRLEDSTWIVPYFGFDWQLHERLRLATEGPRLLLEAELSPSLDARLAVEYEIRQYRLNRRGPLPGGVYQDDQIHFTGELAFALSDHTTLEFAAGLVAWQESTFLNEAGSKVGELESDPAGYGAVTLRFDL